MKRLLVCLFIAVNCMAVENLHWDRTYKITNVTGPMSGREGDFRLHLLGDRLMLENKHTKRHLDINGNQISGVMYTPVRFSRVEQNPIPVFSGGCYGQGCGGEVLLYIAAALVLAPMHGHSHFIRITWTEQSVEQELEFEIGKTDCESLLQALRQFVGVKYIDVEEQARRVRHELEQNVSQAFPITLDHASRLGNYDINAGEYRVITLERENGKSDVYLFEARGGNRVDVEKVRAAAQAKVAENGGGAAIDYVGSTSKISAIRTPAHAYLFHPTD